MKKAILPLVISMTLCLPSATGADFKWWADGKTGGQINLTTANGTTRSALPSNPTGAQAVRSGNVQAPTVIVQATASLPIKAVGDTCTASGTTTANEGTAITADRTMLLTCQSGEWMKLANSGSRIGGYTFKVLGSITPMYGTGSFDTSTNKFSGDMMCNPAIVASMCGTIARDWCGSSESCAYTYADAYHLISVSGLAVHTVVKQW